MFEKIALLDFLDTAELIFTRQGQLDHTNFIRGLRTRVREAKFSAAKETGAIDPATIITIIMSIVSLFLNPTNLSAIITQINTILTQLGLPPLPVPASIQASAIREFSAPLQVFSLPDTLVKGSSL